MPPRPPNSASPPLAPPATPVQIRVFLADESELFRLGVKALLARESSPPLLVVGEAGTVAEATRLCSETEPAVLLLDMRFPDGSGADLCRNVLGSIPGLRAIALTAHARDIFVYEAVTAGALGYLLKNISPATLLDGIREVAAGRSILDVDATARVVRLLRRNGSRGDVLAPLSRQERKVLALVAEGLTNKQIGARLGLAKDTVKNYLISVFEKLKVKRRAQAATLYVQALEAGPDTSADE